MRRLLITFGLFVLLSTSALAGPKEDVLAAYDKFFTLFTTGNQKQLAALFAPDALFYGTGSAEVVTTPEGVVAYFPGALSGTRGEVKARPFESKALMLSESVVAISGKWQSERTLEGKMVTAGPSRVTVVMQKRGDDWLIVQFHNSPTPKPAPATPAAVPSR
ncbi:MAG: nuclear transport factor 2 family protein [Proteobacteria bacterium]|nr:nuclear transport factor 2 family protein [Pseudomonadota bacterium]